MATEPNATATALRLDGILSPRRDVHEAADVMEGVSSERADVADERAMGTMAYKWLTLVRINAPERAWGPGQWWWFSRLLARRGARETIWRVRDVAGKSRPVFLDEKGHYWLGTIKPANLEESGIRDLIAILAWIIVFSFGVGSFTVAVDWKVRFIMWGVCVCSAAFALLFILVGEARREARLVRLYAYEGQEVSRRAVANAVANMIERMERGERIDIPRLEEVRWTEVVRKIEDNKGVARG